MLAVVFGAIMVFVVFQEQNEHIIPNLFLNVLLFFFLSTGYSIIVEALNISWIEKPITRLIVELVTTAIYIALVAVFALVITFFLFYDYSFLGAFQQLNWRFFRMVFFISYAFGFILTCRAFLRNWKTAEIQAAQLREAQAAAQYEGLKNQVNPHFLFNSLNVLTTLVYKDQDLAAKYIKQLSNTYRYVLQNQNKEIVTLSKELEALNAYIFLMKIRFGEGFQVNIDVPAQQDYCIAPLTLQMLVENAVKHNIVDEERQLWVHIKVEAGYIIVQNNLQKKNNEAESIGVGLANIQQRYRFLTDQPIKIIPSETTFEVWIPLVEVD